MRIEFGASTPSNMAVDVSRNWHLDATGSATGGTVCHAIFDDAGGYQSGFALFLAGSMHLLDFKATRYGKLTILVQ